METNNQEFEDEILSDEDGLEIEIEDEDEDLDDEDDETELS